MYPDFHELAKYLFGINEPWEWLSIIKTFGFLVALSFLGAAYTLTMELKRKESDGYLIPEFTTTEVGKPAGTDELLFSAIIGFILGYKLGGLFGNMDNVAHNPLGYLFTLKGNVVIGLIGAAISAYIRYSDKKKRVLAEPKIVKTAIYPHQRVGEFLFIAAAGGFLGAKVFNAFETWDDFIKNPAENLLSSGGLTFYGGLIVATIAMYFFARKHNIGFTHLCDAVAPGLMLAYGVGRFGCQFAGDGDWGIFNSAYITNTAGQLVKAAPGAFQSLVQSNPNYFLRDFHNLNAVPQAYAPAPGWLPQWLFAMNYPHNVINEGMSLTGCVGDYCSVLPVGVFPTPLYEAIVCICLFFVLWSIRKKVTKPFHLFGIYLILNGLERFFIEKIRVNYEYDWGFIHPSQAEIISTCLIIAGVAILLFYKDKKGRIVEPGGVTV